MGSKVKMIWQELITTDFDRIDRQTPVILPIAAIEQHGPHLPLATDRMIAEHFAGEVHRQLNDGVLVLPTVAVGYSEHHMEFPGSLTLAHDVLLGVGEHYLLSAARHGFRNFLVLNAHGGNQGVCRVLLEKFGTAHPKCQIVTATWWRVAGEALIALNDSGPGGVGHAGEFETSLMLHIAPELVRMDECLPKANTSTYDWAESDLVRAPRAEIFRTMKQMTEHGAYGDCSPSSAEKGEAISGLVCQALCEIIRDLANGPQQ
ncbi:MAG: creatininase family protein [Pseudomonadota bacterium]